MTHLAPPRVGAPDSERAIEMRRWPRRATQLHSPDAAIQKEPRPRDRIEGENMKVSLRRILASLVAVLLSLEGAALAFVGHEHKSLGDGAAKRFFAVRRSNTPALPWRHDPGGRWVVAGNPVGLGEWQPTNNAVVGPGQSLLVWVGKSAMRHPEIGRASVSW